MNLQKNDPVFKLPENAVSLFHDIFSLLENGGKEMEKMAAENLICAASSLRIHLSSRIPRRIITEGRACYRGKGPFNILWFLINSDTIGGYHGQNEQAV